MKIKYNYLDKQFENPKSIFLSWKKFIKTTDFTLGHKVKEFEKKISSYLGIKYIVSTNNGTDAIILCLRSLGIGKGDEVITVCNSFYATVGSIVAVGAKPVFVDSDIRYQINADHITRAITKKTKAIMPVHWGGASPDILKIVDIAKKNKIHVIEDACMGIGGKINKKSPGSFGIISAFSMHPLKSLNVMGDGGFVATNNKKIFKWLLKYRNHGMVERDKIDFWGINARLQPLQAIVAIHELDKLNNYLKLRNRNAKFLDKNLAKLYPNVILPKRNLNNFETFALYMAEFNNRNNLRKFLSKNNIETKIHYPIPLHLQKPGKKLGYKRNDFFNAEMQARRLITIPVHQYLNLKHMKYICEKISLFYGKK
jgi:dTDP-4-amino-4,6-dideoxygalactose transaminase